MLSMCSASFAVNGSTAGFAESSAEIAHKTLPFPA
jgi:hypothetical protein